MEHFLDYFKPDHYNLKLTIDRTHELLHGVVGISGYVLSEVVKFHAEDMEIVSVEYETEAYDSSTGEAKTVPCEYTYDDHTISIVTTSEMAPRFYRQRTINDLQNHDFGLSNPDVYFKIRFRARLKNNMQGCYLSTYDWNNQTRRIAATQFESHYAREAFPCIDEPAAKASFTLMLDVPDLAPDETVLANSEPGWIGFNGKSFTFRKTPKMSTYLLAWVIGPFKSVSTVNNHGVKVTSYAALNQPTTSLIFANETAAKALDYYDDEFGIKYPLEKLDQVALPDFEAGAMENWGLVTYRESMMLADNTATLDAKKTIATTVTHELSHQWFGDLVTMKWWDDLWLNESFATIMEYYCTDALYPEFNIWQDFFASDCVVALCRDVLPGVQAVQQEVHHPAEIATLFDSAIVYAKGAHLMLMLIRLMGREDFLKGLRYYFEKHAYQNTVGDDLWNALQPFAKFKVKEFMHAWISQPGFPSLQHAKNGDQEWWDQQRLLIDGTTDDSKWPLPKVTDDMSGHYIIELTSQEFMQKLASFDTLSSEQKLRLLIDRMILARAGIVDSVSLVELISKFSSETSAATWSILTSIIGDIKLFCPADTPVFDDYKAFLSSVFAKQIEAISYDDLGSDSNAIQHRDAIINVAVYIRDTRVLNHLADLYHDHLAKIPHELRSAVLSAKMLMDESSSFDIFLDRYQSESDPELRADLLFAVASHASQPQHLDKLLDLLKRPEIVRPQDHIFLYIYLLRNYHTRERTLLWLTENWPYIEKLTGEKSIEDYPRYAGSIIRTPDEAKIFYDFFNPKQNDPILKRTLEMARFEIDSRLARIKRESSSVHAALKEHGDSQKAAK